MQQLVGDRIKPSSCSDIERGTSLIAPLPAQNTADLVAFIMVMVSRDKAGEKVKMPVCKAAA